MMPEIFVSALLDLGLLTSLQLDQFLESLPAERRDGRLETMVRALVERELVTRFQAKRILSGEADSLILGNYLLCDRLGHGSMGTVYRARHRRMERVVAVKVLEAPETDRDRHYRRFLREVRAAAKLTHPNIVTAHDADEAGGVCYLVMEYVDGQDLKTSVDRDGPFTVAKAVGCILQAARGLHHAHSHGLVHRDVKPANLLLANSGILKILDLGLARVTDREKKTEESGSIDGSSPGRIVGTVDYMSPEQAEDPRAADRRSDVYALGATLYYLLTGQPPFPRENWLGALMAHRNEAIPDLRQLRADVPEGVQTVFERMLAKRPADRFANMAEIVAALSPFDDDSDFQVREDAAIAEPDTGEETRVLELDLPTYTPVVGPGSTSSNQQKSNETNPAHLPLAASLPNDIERKTRGVTFGIDLGTTRSVVVRSDGEREPETVLSSDHTRSVPSVLHVDRHRKLILGNAAVEQLEVDPRHTIAFPLRALAEDSFPRIIFGSALPPTVLVGLLLRELMRSPNVQWQESDSVVIAVPNGFDEARRGAIQTAAYLAGLQRVDLVNRSTALLMAWEAESRRAGEAPLRSGDHLLAFDLGGGSCDLAVYRWQDEGVLTLALGSDLHLGGLDWDQQLIDYAADAFERRYGVDVRKHPASLRRLAARCEATRKALSRDNETLLEVSHDSEVLTLPIARTLLRRLTVDLSDRLSRLVDQVVAQAGISWAQLDRVLLAGGAAKMSTVRRMLAGRWGREPLSPAFFDEAVAAGAARYAQDLARRRIGKVTPERFHEATANDLSYVINDRVSGKSEARLLIPKNSPLPSFCRRSFRTGRFGQRRLTVTLIEGDPAQQGAWIPLGRLSIEELPADLPAGTAVELTFAYRKDGRLAVSYTVQGKTGVPRLERAQGLSAVERSVWRGRIEAGTVFDSDEIGLADEE